MIKGRRKTARGEAGRDGGSEGWEGGRREQASALHVLKGQMVTAGNWGANHSAGHRARDLGGERTHAAQQRRGEEHLRGSCTPSLTGRKTERKDWVLLLLTDKEAQSKKRRREKDRRWEGSKRRGKSLPLCHLERHRDKEGGKQKDRGVRRRRQRMGES